MTLVWPMPAKAASRRPLKTGWTSRKSATRRGPNISLTNCCLNQERCRTSPSCVPGAARGLE
eukprot:3340382-Lingulodinium_polyedra.AAC.1